MDIRYPLSMKPHKFRRLATLILEPPPTSEPYAFHFPTCLLVWTPDPCSPQQRPYAPPAAAGRTGNAEFGQESGSGRQQRPTQPHQQHPPAPHCHLMTRTQQQQPIHQVGVGHFIGYVILGGLHFLHPVQVASRSGVLFLATDAVARGRAYMTSPMAHSQSRQSICTAARMGRE
ncbi:hypothetical protein PISMIDRAFT_275959 [Pisolithus microcarpus 441]|uniref:Unplaced genomic scaffold scaffold_181, whole genome shotgun sequence n=1 Tax=Pisolithus microcarpus 441 TaxID=765257 RepID=A0A0C9Z1I5_9AGAM|nr:hypothetical protein BKA83DRAFT_275959 [Pisolithus microcarpus]KIK16177.1 hypothetical protein PISMIDRAFT_275959 [Pisolithus microcarpus 441]